MKSEYVTLNLENLSKVPVFQRNAAQRRYLWRAWRQLSRLQRNLILLLLVIVVFVIPYWATLGGAKITSNEIQNVPRQDSIDTIFNVALKSDELVGKIETRNIDSVLDEEKKKNDKEWKNEQNPKLSVAFPIAKDSRQKAVINAMKHAWKGYSTYAWGHDHLKPISRTHEDWFNLGLTIIDSLDTLYIMNLHDEFKQARDWVEKSFNLDNYKDVNLFEVTIRVLGGLLTAYHFTEDTIFLEKAMDLGERLMPCFTRSPSPIPYSDVNLATRSAHPPKWGPDSSTAEVTTLQLEFRDLSRCVSDPKFEEAAFEVTKHIHKLEKIDGLVPIFINPNTGKFHTGSEIKLGARGDSYYEYLLKQWIQTGKTINYLKTDYIEAIDGIMKKLVKVTPNRKLVFIGELKASSYEFSPKMDHLTCYLPGTLALGVRHGMPKWHMRFAEQLMETCYHMYADQPTFLSPEIVYFNYEEGGENPDMYVHENDAHNLLRPEFIESLWYLYRITGNTTYQDWGWSIFEAIERYSKVADGYTSIGSVLDASNTIPWDKMESFFLSETLKYLYLLFSPKGDVLDIDKFVMNSEGHPLPIYSSLLPFLRIFHTTLNCESSVSSQKDEL